jgi:putative ABC transport system substrate-binding protein
MARTSIPIVFVQVADPVEAGFVASLAHPSGNITGFGSTENAMGGKYLELLKEIAPGVTQMAVILTPDNVTNAGHFHVIEGVAASIGVQSASAAVRDSAEIERAIDAFARNSNGGLIVLANPVTNTYRELIVALAAWHNHDLGQPIVEGGIRVRGYPSRQGKNWHGRRVGAQDQGGCNSDHQ